MQDCVSIGLGHGFLLGVASRAGPDIMRICDNIMRSCEVIMHFCDNIMQSCELIMQLCEVIEQSQNFSLEAGAASK